MDSAVTRRVLMLRAARCAAVACWLAAAAQAQSLADPTKPPAVMGVQGGEKGEPGEPAALQLQSILVSREPGGRRVAVINGEMVRVGMKVGDAVLERVGETEVVLRRGTARETLKLFAKP